MRRRMRAARSQLRLLGSFCSGSSIPTRRGNASLSLSKRTDLPEWGVSVFGRGGAVGWERRRAQEDGVCLNDWGTNDDVRAGHEQAGNDGVWGYEIERCMLHVYEHSHDHVEGKAAKGGCGVTGRIVMLLDVMGAEQLTNDRHLGNPTTTIPSPHVRLFKADPLPQSYTRPLLPHPRVHAINAYHPPQQTHHCHHLPSRSHGIHRPRRNRPSATRRDTGTVQQGILRKAVRVDAKGSDHGGRRGIGGDGVERRCGQLLLVRLALPAANSRTRRRQSRTPRHARTRTSRDRIWNTMDLAGAMGRVVQRRRGEKRTLGCTYNLLHREPG
jgi:hypothetical protein